MTKFSLGPAPISPAWDIVAWGPATNTCLATLILPFCVVEPGSRVRKSFAQTCSSLMDQKLPGQPRLLQEPLFAFQVELVMPAHLQTPPQVHFDWEKQASVLPSSPLLSCGTCLKSFWYFLVSFHCFLSRNRLARCTFIFFGHILALH